MNTEPLRVCSYNIHKGFNASNRRFLLQDIRDAIRGINADFVFLQEVMGENHRRQGKQADNQFEYLADSIWHHHAYGQNAIYSKGHHGNAILSKYPFMEQRNIDVSHWRFSQRGLLLGKTAIGVYLLCTHFGLFARERRVQLQALIELVNNEIPAHAPLIIAGDFNDWNLAVDTRLKDTLQLHEAYSTLFGQPAKSFPSRFPLLAMDRIYYRNIELEHAEVLSGKPWSRLSDHCALAATFMPPACPEPMPGHHGQATAISPE